MVEIKTICLRLNLDKPIHRKAYDYLKSQSTFKSKSSAIASAVADYFDNQAREERLVGRFIEALGNRPILPPVSETSVEKPSEDLTAEIDFDFLGG